MKKICRYINILLLNSVFFSLCGSGLSAQNNEEEFNPRLWQGLRVEADVASVVLSLLSGGETYSYEGALTANLKHKYFPVIEFGFAGADKKSEIGANFLSNGFFGRIGVDINMMKVKKEQERNNFFTLGARLGMTGLKYDINNVIVEDGYWGESEVHNFEGISATKLWYEIVAGVHVEVFPRVYLGWNIRLKNTIGKDKNSVTPWYIPGFGKYGLSAVWAFNYTVGFRF
ncbi:MAG: DUF6048 family protein [Prevotellaceae bacterium]|jgi:hypothetical protein|nr:DUF6048 family protein [Prevotellaceae bacterium]